MRLKMPKQKRKRTAAEKAEKKRRSLEYMTIFINGKQKRVKRPQLIDGIDADEFIRRNADPIWLHQAEMWEDMNTEEADETYGEAASDMPSQACDAIADGRKQWFWHWPLNVLSKIRGMNIEWLARRCTGSLMRPATLLLFSFNAYSSSLTRNRKFQ